MILDNARSRFVSAWTRFWMKRSGLGRTGRISTRLAAFFVPAYKSRCPLARLSVKGYISPSAAINHDRLAFGRHVFIGDRVVIYKAHEGGGVEIGMGSHVHNDTIIETGSGGSLTIGENTHIQPRCQFSAYKSTIFIGNGVQIAPNCAFYPYNHRMSPLEPIHRQTLTSKGGIHIDDDAWIGVGVIVLDGVRIGRGAVIGAGAVVTRDIPDGAIAAGVPAKVIGMRSSIPSEDGGKTGKEVLR